MSTYVDNNGKPTIDKDPDAVLDYPFDWTDWLMPIDDKIVSVEFIATAPLVVESTGFDDYTATAWVSGGGAVTVPPKTLALTCRITTNNLPARTEDRTIYLKIKAR